MWWNGGEGVWRERGRERGGGWVNEEGEKERDKTGDKKDLLVRRSRLLPRRRRRIRSEVKSR